MNKATLLALSLTLSLGGGLIGCSTAPKSSADKETLSANTDVTLAAMQRQSPDINNIVKNAYGYAIFPEVGKGGFIAGGSFGRGEVFQEGKFVGYAKIEQATVGLQAGGQTYDMLIVFENATALMKFKNNEYTPAANATAVILKEGVGTGTAFKDGVATFVRPTGGAMAEAAIGGQKFTFEAATERANNK